MTIFPDRMATTCVAYLAASSGRAGPRPTFDRLVQLGTEVENLDLVGDVEKVWSVRRATTPGVRCASVMAIPYPLTLSPTQLVHQLVCCISHSDFIQGLGDNMLVFG